MKKSDIHADRYYTLKATGETVRVASSTDTGFLVWEQDGQEPFEVTARELSPANPPPSDVSQNGGNQP